MATLGHLKIKLLWNNVYDVIISVHDVTNKILSRNSNYTVDVGLWPKYCKSRISIIEVIITSILQGLDLKNDFFRRLVLVQVQ